jgi:S-adenosylmethionine:tRNA ribosyltransferase-isomerase
MSTITFAEIAPATAPRPDVSLLVATRADGAIAQTRFAELPRLLRPGDLLVVNTSATLPAALPGTLDGAEVRVHLSTPLAADRWVVELRTAELGPLRPSPVAGDVALPGGGRLTLAGPYLGSERLREADLALPGGTAAYLDRHGTPIRYADHGAAWPLSAYQTVFAREPGSAEMPSAGRPFTDALVTELVTSGVLVAPLVLHAGVSSPERDEPPFPERFRVPAETARLVGAVRGWGGRVIAVGTTVVRALETVALPGGAVRAGEGWTSLVVTPERGLRVVDGLITGWHEPESSHLLMLEAAAGRELLQRSYDEAAERGLEGHEFGDALLVLPS